MVEPLRAWRVRRKFGDRSLDLLMLAVVWLVVGYMITVNDPEPDVKVPIEYLGTPVRIAVWWIGAAAAAIAAFRVTRYDQWGFAALMVGPLLRCLSYTFAWFTGVVADPLQRWFGVMPDGDIGIWPEAVVWAVVSGIVYRLAKRPEIPCTDELRAGLTASQLDTQQLTPRPPLGQRDGDQ
jgi:hypothetical protein